MLRDIQRLEAMIIIDDFIIILDCKAHGCENFLTITLYKRNRMIGAFLQFQRLGQIEFRGHGDLTLHFFHMRLHRLLSNRLFRSFLQFIDFLSILAALIGSQCAHVLQKACYLAFLSEIADTKLFKGFAGIRICQVFTELFPQFIHRYCHSFLLQ